MKLAFDIEANGLLDTITKIHCIEACDVETGKTYSFDPTQIEQGLDLLAQADFLIGHNIIAYDLPALQKVHNFTTRATLIDTLVVARLMYADVGSRDTDLIQQGKLDKELYKRHSLKAWGQRLGNYKGDYEGPWDTWSQEMQTYCAQDVQVTVALWHYLKPQGYSPLAVELEHDIHRVCLLMEEQGWTFNKEKAVDLYGTLVKRRDELASQLIAKFGTWRVVDKVFIPKRDNKTLGYLKGVEVTKYKTIEFNPNSRQHIELKLRELGWKPTEYTPSGQAKLDEDILVDLPFPEAKLLVEHFIVEKRLGQLADGDNGWLRVLSPDSRIHGRYNTMGTITGRASHYSPNIGQVPANGAPYGHQCRELFTAPTGWSMVGADMAGLELRCLAHYISHFDGGEYAEVVLNGDVHTANQKAAGLPTRDNAKTFIYAFLYGAGATKIGTIVSGTAKQGQELINRFMSNFPALKRLRSAVSQGAGKGYLKGLDGRHITIRSEHAALNSLLQGCGAILCKRWVVDAFNAISTKYRFGYDGDFVFCGWIHDEIQVACRTEIAQDVGHMLSECARNAGQRYGFNVRLDSEFKVGTSWAETH